MQWRGTQRQLFMFSGCRNGHENDRDSLMYLLYLAIARCIDSSIGSGFGPPWLSVYSGPAGLELSAVMDSHSVDWRT